MTESQASLVARARFRLQASCTDDNVDRDAFEEGLDEQLGDVMQELIDDNRIIDPVVHAELSTGLVTISFDVPWNDDLDEASNLANNAVRAAIHAAGGGTPNWRDDNPVVEPHAQFDFREAGIELVDA